jgi:ankyrin repeat protein
MVQAKLDQVINSIQDLSRASAIQTDLDVSKSLEYSESALSNHSIATKNKDFVCINTALVSDRCSNICRCICHKQGQIKTPRALREIVGSLFYSYTGTPMFNRRQCDFPLCQRTRYGTIRLTYLFPWWAIARAICITGLWRDLSGVGASWAIRMPRLVDWGPIWSAIEHGDERSIFELFKERKASPFDIHGGDGRSLLHHAIWYKRFHICYQIALEGADWAHRDVDGSSPADVLWPSILTGIGYEDPALVQLRGLLERDYDFENMGFNSLHIIVVQLSKISLAEQLMFDYAAVNKTDTHGRTPLMWAAMRNDLSMIEILLKWKADVHMKDHEGLTALHYVARQGAYECAELLLKAGCQVDIKDYAGRTPLIDFCFHSRAQVDQIPLFRLLVNSGGDVHCKSDRRHWTCLHMAAAAGNTDILQLLLDRGVDVNARNKDGNTPIMMALSENRLNAVLMLLKYDAKLDFYNKLGRGTLILAACYGSMAIMEALTEVQICGIDVEAPDCNGNTARNHFESFRSRNLDEENFKKEAEQATFLALLASVNQEKGSYQGAHENKDERETAVDEIQMMKKMSGSGNTISCEGDVVPEIDNDDIMSMSTGSIGSNTLFKSCTLIDEGDCENVDVFVDAFSRINSLEV